MKITMHIEDPSKELLELLIGKGTVEVTGSKSKPKSKPKPKPEEEDEEDEVEEDDEVAEDDEEEDDEPAELTAASVKKLVMEKSKSDPAKRKKAKELLTKLGADTIEELSLVKLKKFHDQIQKL